MNRGDQVANSMISIWRQKIKSNKIEEIGEVTRINTGATENSGDALAPQTLGDGLVRVVERDAVGCP